jgi:hypothetical protein
LLNIISLGPDIPRLVRATKSRSSLEQIFADVGLSKGTRLVVSCHVGQQACVLYAVARSLGYQAAVYGGSFQDCNLRGEEYPVERIEPVKKEEGSAESSLDQGSGNAEDLVGLQAQGPARVGQTVFKGDPGIPLPVRSIHRLKRQA